MFYQNSDTIMSSKNGMKVSFSFSALNPTSDIYEKSSKLIFFFFSRKCPFIPNFFYRSVLIPNS